MVCIVHRKFQISAMTLEEKVKVKNLSYDSKRVFPVQRLVEGVYIQHKNYLVCLDYNKGFRSPI